ncbi:MAG: hypothetical protein LZF61_02180 [Nitrosomonas sp.]|nr:MAG: hypothetical protein LZF61_02180 [Nitrosomonas sp.]
MNFPALKWLLLFFMLWLPLQAVAAAVLSVCAQENINHHAEQAGSDHHHGDCHKQNGDHGSEHVLTSLPCDESSCDTYSHTPIPPDHAVSPAIGSRSAIISYLSGFVSFIPEQPQHPPLID